MRSERMRRGGLKKLLYGAALIAGTATSSGCFAINKLEDILPQVQAEKEYNRTVDSVIEHYFVESAQTILKEADVHPGPALGGYVTVNLWGKIASTLTLNGPGLNVIVPEWMLRSEGVGILNHEFAHILDWKDREKEGEFIDHKEFEIAYKRFLKDPEYKTIAKNVEKRVQNGNWFTGLFGIGPLSEEIGWTAGYASLNPELFPAYLKRTLTGMFREEVLFPKAK